MNFALAHLSLTKFMFFPEIIPANVQSYTMTGYPKAWGHGTDSIQLVKNIGNKSMVDTMVFKTEITKQLKPNKGVHVPHSGINLSSEKSRQVKVPPVPRM